MKILKAVIDTRFLFISYLSRSCKRKLVFIRVFNLIELKVGSTCTHDHKRFSVCQTSILLYIILGSRVFSELKK